MPQFRHGPLGGRTVPSTTRQSELVLRSRPDDDEQPDLVPDDGVTMGDLYSLDRTSGEWVYVGTRTRS